jgi:hypothetical protein
MSGHELVWDDVNKTVDSQIEAAESSGEAEDAIEELRLLRARLNALQATGTVSEHPAAAYDRAVEAAIRRLVPNAPLRVEDARSRSVADIMMDDPGGLLFIETKWRSDPCCGLPRQHAPRTHSSASRGRPVAGGGERRCRPNVSGRGIRRQSAGPPRSSRRLARCT